MEETAGGNNSDEGKKKKKVEKQTYKYRKDDSIVDATADVYSLTDDEYNQLTCSTLPIQCAKDKAERQELLLIMDGRITNIRNPV